jgi:hypothetical protein
VTVAAESAINGVVPATKIASRCPSIRFIPSETLELIFSQVKDNLLIPALFPQGGMRAAPS